MTKVSYTAESVIRALDIHKAAGLIRDWQYNQAAPWKRGGTERPFCLLVDLVDGESGFELRTLREAYVFVCGLASAHHAQLRRQPANLDDADLEALLAEAVGENNRRAVAKLTGQP
jgi:hypothetical protein